MHFGLQYMFDLSIQEAERLMEAEQINAMDEQLEALNTRTRDLRRYL
ncbi:hypothetical protein SAMN05216326_11221 [Nitrosomonas marina]|uniref:Uncharacterized protein n=1 Tax=Nitrosomonas marina TaxID=917 RepID=A0A1I0BWP6_9PROT|nr:hypothetical protein SAMN05216326_11221 [Nitrosomonas marina]